VTYALRVTLPVKAPVGVTVITEVFPAVAPGAMDTAVPLMVKEELPTLVTVTEFDPRAPL
jgi:hypothetical protein